MSWQKVARLLIAVFVVVFAAVVFLALRRGKDSEPAPPPEVKRIDEKATAQTTGPGHYSRTKEGKVAWSIRWNGGQVTYPEGRSKVFGDVVVEIDRGGRKYKIASREAEVSQNDKLLQQGRFLGDVILTTDDGLEAKTGEAIYDDSDGIVKVPGAVEFTRKRMKGRGVGAIYDRNRDVLWLLDSAHISVAPDEQGKGALEADAKSIGLARADHYVRLEREARIEAEGRTVRADEIVITMTEDDEHIQMIQLRANSRIDGAGGTGLQMMAAKDIDLTYGADGRTLQFAKLMENAVVQLAGAARGPGRRVAGKAIDIAMSPNGTAVTNLTANEQVQLDLPAEGDIPARRIRAASLIAAGADQGLQEATFSGDVDYRETRAARDKTAALNRTARSMRLTVKTKPGLGALQEADFRGNVVFNDGTATTARAPHATYRVDGDRIDLAPSDDPGQGPIVSDGRIEVQARTIAFTLGTHSFNADTKVRGVVLPQKGAKPAGESARVPAMLKQDDMVTVTSNRLEYDGSASRAVYSGDARLWQAETEIRADTITLDDKNGNLTAQTNVKTQFFFEQADAKTKQKKPVRQDGTADSFMYDDAKRVATYTTNAVLNGPEGNLTADKVELHLEGKTNELERVEAYGNVTLKEGVRTVTGARLTYTVAEDGYVMSGVPGKPVYLMEKGQTSCTEMIGPKLVFFRTTHSMKVDGQSKSGTCGTYKR